jgi:putative transcription factor
MLQDWETTIIRNKHGVKNTKEAQNVKTETVKKYTTGNSNTVKVNAKKIEEGIDNDTFTLPTVSVDTRLKIQQARQKKGWSQKELAQKCNLHVNVIQSYENGSITPIKQHLSIISNALETKL